MKFRYATFLIHQIFPIGLFQGLVISALFTLNSCNHCYPCLAKGDNFDLPYQNNQLVNFINDSAIIEKFTVSSAIQLPPSEYCGPIGSESYGDCQGDEKATFASNNTSSDIFIKIYFNTGNTDKVELPVYKYITLNSSSFSILQNEIRTSDIDASVQELNSITLNGKIYKDLIEYTRSSSYVNMNKCIYILYSKVFGILKFQINRANFIENWTLDN